MHTHIIPVLAFTIATGCKGLSSVILSFFVLCPKDPSDTASGDFLIIFA